MMLSIPRAGLTLAATRLAPAELPLSTPLIASKTFFASHHEYGDLKITRHEKTDPGVNFVRFDVENLSGLNRWGEMREAAGLDAMGITVDIDNADAYISSNPSLGYKCGLGGSLLEPGANAVLHACIAETGEELEIDNIVVSNATGGGSAQDFCESLGMRRVGHDGYALSTKQLLEEAQRLAAREGWTLVLEESVER